MKTFFKTSFCLVLAIALTVGVSVLVTPDAEAGGTCPPCYVPAGAPGWVQVGSCVDGPSHCPVAYKTYRNTYTGQVCRGQFGIAPI